QRSRSVTTPMIFRLSSLSITGTTPACSSRMMHAAFAAESDGRQHCGSFVMTFRMRIVTPPPTGSGEEGSNRRALGRDLAAVGKNTIVAAVLARGVHEPLHDLGLRARRDLARRREHEAGVARGGVHAALAVRVHPLLRRP